MSVQTDRIPPAVAAILNHDRFLREAGLRCKVLPIAISLFLPCDRRGRPSSLSRGARSVTVGTRCNRANAVPQSHRSSAPPPPAQAGRGGLCAYPRLGAPFLRDAASG